MEEKLKYCVICGNKLNGSQQKFCSASCKQKDFYHNHKNNSSFAQFLRSAKRKLELVEYKGGKCERCGYNKNISALEFHHINSSEKKFNIDGRLLANKKMEELIDEANKCMLLCSNCHKEVHHEGHNIETIKEFLNEEKITKDKIEVFVCKECGKVLSKHNKTKLCSECYLKYSLTLRKVERPSAEELSELLKTNSLNKIGKMYGVSHASVKKWGIKYGLIKDN